MRTGSRTGRPPQANFQTIKPFVDQPLGMPGEGPIAFRVADDAVVVPVALRLAPEGGGQFGERNAPRFLHPVLERGQSGPELLRIRGASHPPVVGIVPAFPPLEVEAETAMGAIAPPPPAKPDRRARRRRDKGELPAAVRLPPVEFDQRALFFSEFEPELRQSSGQHPEIGFGIVWKPEGTRSIDRPPSSADEGPNR